MIHLHKIKKAFTMIELVFAIVVIGILASLAMPRIDRDLVNEASSNILSDIRYTQHLAINDNKHMFNNPQWQRKWWRIGFQKCTVGSGGGWFETVSTDLDMGGDIDAGEEAIDPSNNLPMDVSGNDCAATGLNKRMLLTKNYGITNIAKNANCNNANMYIGFDYLGRPHSGYLGSNQPNYANYLANDCILTFTMSDATSFQIQITAETGHAFILGQPDS